MLTVTPYYNYYKHFNLINNSKVNNDLYNAIKNDIKNEFIQPLIKCWLDDYVDEGIIYGGIGPKFTDFMCEKIANIDIMTPTTLEKSWIYESAYRDYIFDLLLNKNKYTTAYNNFCNQNLFNTYYLYNEVYKMLSNYE